jgi:hypothetical protein
MHTHYLHFGKLGGLGSMHFPVSIMRQFTDKKTDLHPLAHDKVISFKTQYFEDVNYMTVEDVKQLTTFEANYLRIGEVLMVRSENVTTMGDHFVIISGPITNKEHGVRPETMAIAASPNGYSLLDLFEPMNGTILLHLSPRLRDAFHAFNEMKVEGRKVEYLTSKTA